MSAMGQPYSDSAMSHAKGILRGKLLTGWQELEMGAALMHDREALGLDASVHAASYRQEVIAELVAWLEAEGFRFGAQAVREFAESEATHDQ